MHRDTLKKLRGEKRLSQAELAEILKISQQTIASWEVGRTEPDNEMLVKIAKYFDVSVDYLLGQTVVRRPIETVAAHRTNMDEQMTEEEEEELASYLKYMRARNSMRKHQQPQQP